MRKLLIVSEKTRGHFTSGTNRLNKFKVVHLYKSTFSDMPQKHSRDFIRYRNVFELYRLLDKEKPDLIQSLEPYYGYSRFGLPWKILPIMLATHWYCRKNHVPYFIHFLENLPPSVKYRWPFGVIMKGFAKILTRSASLLFYVNNGAKRNIELLGQKAKARYGFWGLWGVDTSVFKPRDDFDKNQILFVGRLSFQKGALDLIEMFSIVKKRLPEAKLMVIGEGELKGEFKKQIKQEHLSGITLKGEVAYDKIISFFQNCSLLVMPSKTLRYSAEQVGMVSLEAMACGKPVVGYDSGSIGEFIQNGRAGFLVPEGNVKKLAEKVLALLLDGKLRDNLGKNAQEFIHEKFEIKKNVPALEDEINRSLFEGRGN